MQQRLMQTYRISDSAKIPIDYPCAYVGHTLNYLSDVCRNFIILATEKAECKKVIKLVGQF